MREGNLPTRVDRAHRRYLHADPALNAASRNLFPHFHRLIPPIFLVTVTAVVLLGGGFWSPANPIDPVTGLPIQQDLSAQNLALLNGSSVTPPDTSSGDGTAVDVTVTVPGGTTTTALRATANDSTFMGYLSRPGTVVTNIPQRVSIVPALRGDTLEKIATRMNTTPVALMFANGLTDFTSALTAGQTIRVPPPGTMLHRIKVTDTIDGIARAYQVKVEEITGYPGNNVSQSSDLVPGNFLIIPTMRLPIRDHVVFYQLQQGDSLSRVSALYGLKDPHTLQWANDLPRVDSIVLPGQILAIPPTDGLIHVVEQDDTQRTIDDAITQIAKNFACVSIPCNDPPADDRVNDLAAKIFAFGGNHLTHGGKLVLGQEIVIPGGIPYVAPPPIIIPQNVTLDNPGTSGSAAGGTSYGAAPRTSGSISGGGNGSIVGVAQRYLGAYRQPSGLPWAFWCEKFVGDVAQQAGVSHYRYATAIADAYSGPLYRSRAPAGALVFFDTSWNYAGHVGIAMGDGTMISALSNGIVRTAYEGSGGYMGWRPFP